MRELVRMVDKSNLRNVAADRLTFSLGADLQPAALIPLFLFR